MHICDIQKIPSGDGLGSYKLFFLVINVFHRGLTDLPREAIMLLEWVLTSNSKETYNHLCVSRGGGGGAGGIRTHVMHWSIFIFHSRSHPSN